MTEAQIQGSATDAAFPFFAKLPAELRLRIFHYALEYATKKRVIRAAVYSRLFTTIHACVRALLNINLACREGRHAVLSRYSKVLRVYDRYWHGAHRRYLLVRCDPARDVLLITNVPDLTDDHTNGAQPRESRESGLRRRIPDIDEYFPQDASLFASFRDIVSSFKHVAFLYGGYRSHVPRRLGTPPRDDELVWRQGRGDTPRSDHFRYLLLFFESLRTVYIWPELQYWQDVHKDAIRVDDVTSLVIPDSGDRSDLNGIAEEVQDGHKDYARIHNSHNADGHEHWVPKAKPLLGRVGCYAAAAWLTDDGRSCWKN
ncbi:hypothetical protein EDB80DRAFT_898777 [Ilyonectria destructans]|nr:hypothetical protein EDB80DRAFT_898777 [Ilyonectria destructans]